MIRIGDPIALTVGAATLGHVRITPKRTLSDDDVKRIAKQLGKEPRR